MVIALPGIGVCLSINDQPMFIDSELRFESINVADMLLMRHSIPQSLEKKHRYSDADKLSMENKILLAYGDIDYIEFLYGVAEPAHNELFLNFNELAALIDIAIKSLQDMTWVIVEVYNISVYNNSDDININILVATDISGLIDKINIKYEENIQIFFEVKMQTYIDIEAMQCKNISINAINAKVDRRLLEYGFYYAFDTMDYCGMIISFVTNIFNCLGRPQIQEQGIKFENMET